MNRYLFHDLLWDLRRTKAVTLPSGKVDSPRALLSYLPRPVGWRKGDHRFHRHSNSWECREIANQLRSMDYAVDAIHFDDGGFEPRADYDILIDIHRNMERLAPLLPDSNKLLHMTESFSYFQNAAEAGRAEDFEVRTGVPYRPKRMVRDPEVFERSLRLADHCSLIGNEVTLSTYPEDMREKISLVTVSASLGHIKHPEKLTAGQREFMWFFGTGAVHKGLDLTLEAFRDLPGCTLNVIGKVDHEDDFMAAYGQDLRGSANVRYHGYLDPAGKRFREIADRCIAFVAPSCSEGISPAAATVMRCGLYPIVSRETGITLPEDCGTYLEDCQIDEIRQACENVAERSGDSFRQEIAACQDLALSEYSRERFTADMHQYLDDSLDACG